MIIFQAAKALDCTPMEVLDAPDWIVRRALFHKSAENQGLADKYQNERNDNEAYQAAFGKNYHR